MTNNVRDTDDGRVWGSSHCLLRKERIWRGGSKIFLPNIFVNIFPSSNFTHISTLFVCKILSQSIFSRIFPTNIFYFWAGFSVNWLSIYISANTIFLISAFSNPFFDQVELRGGFCFDEAFVLHALERLAESVFVFVLVFVFVFIPLIRQVCCSSVSGLQSISWWVVGAHNVRWTTTQPPTGETTGLSRSHTVPTPPHWQNTTSVKKIFLGLSALAIEKQHCIIPLANSLKYLTFETAK